MSNEPCAKDDPLPEYELRRITPHGQHPGVTFVVSHNQTVLWTPEYTRHVLVTKYGGFVKEQIAWGGILNEMGQWVRPSFDFGDAPNPQERAKVVQLLKNAQYR
jgi:hypothetical protein